MPVSEKDRNVATLQGLLDELSSPDLTLGRAKVLRPRLFALLETLTSRNPRASDGAGNRAEVESDGPSRRDCDRPGRFFISNSPHPPTSYKNRA
jgi:hypothetical protein